MGREEDEDADEPAAPLSFIIRFWVAQPPANDEPPRWRGQITHVPSGERRYLQSFAELQAFILSYLKVLNVETDEVSEKRRRWWRFGRD